MYTIRILWLQRIKTNFHCTPVAKFTKFHQLLLSHREVQKIISDGSKWFCDSQRKSKTPYFVSYFCTTNQHLKRFLVVDIIIINPTALHSLVCSLAWLEFKIKITLTLEFCAQPLRHVWLMCEQIAELEQYVEYRAIKNLSGFNGFTSDYRS